MRSEVYFYDDEKDIPEGYRYDCENDEVYEYRNPYNGKVIHVAKNPPMYVKAIPIPDNATNGDVIKALFPDAKPKRNLASGILYFGRSQTMMRYTNEWWNASYKSSESK